MDFNVMPRCNFTSRAMNYRNNGNNGPVPDLLSSEAWGPALTEDSC